MTKNCPNCGAPVEGTSCRYCGTSFVSLGDVPSIMAGRRVHMFFEDDNGHVHCCDVMVNEVTRGCDYEMLFADDTLYRSISNPNSMTISGYLVDPDREVFIDTINRLGMIK